MFILTKIFKRITEKMETHNPDEEDTKEDQEDTATEIFKGIKRFSP